MRTSCPGLFKDLPQKTQKLMQQFHDDSKSILWKNSSEGEKRQDAFHMPLSLHQTMQPLFWVELDPTDCFLDGTDRYYKLYFFKQEEQVQKDGSPKVWTRQPDHIARIYSDGRVTDDQGASLLARSDRLPGIFYPKHPYFELRLQLPKVQGYFKEVLSALTDNRVYPKP